MNNGLVLVLAAVLSVLVRRTLTISSHEKALYKEKVLEMFFHGFHSYMDHAYPADELMPLTCKGRVRGRDRNRGDIDDALGRFSLTLVDTLDTLAVLGQIDEFNKAIKTVIRDVTFDRDLVVSVFETNIRILGGLLGAHFAAESLKEKGYPQLSWYNGHLIPKAKEVGERLLPAFNTSTGLPYSRVNLRYGMENHWNTDNTTCTACAGTIVMEFAALSRVTGDPKFEVVAHKAMEALWQSRHHGHNLLGTVINVQNGEWMRRDSGVGAGSDSYYEYCLKAYILLGDQEYLKRFQLHYKAIMKYISSGPMLVDVSMNTPTRMTRSYMDSLLAFWPGLQVLWGDVDAAIHTHDMLYHVTERHNFLPEAFTLDFRVHWGNHPLRPEFSESTYFLYKATGDPYYLDVGKSIVDNLNEYARVVCGFASIKDLRRNEHEDRMDSFVLAETFKYLFLLFAEEEDTPLDMDDFVFSTEAHLFPLSLASHNSTLNQEVKDARILSLPRPPSSPTTSVNTPQQSNHTSRNDATPTQASAPPVPPSLIIKDLQCPNDYRPFVIQDQFEKLVLKQCTSSRFRNRPIKRPSKNMTPPRLTVNEINFSSREHLVTLGELGIKVEGMGDGRVQVSHQMQNAKTPADAEEGWFLMQDIMKLMTEQKRQQESVKRTTKLIQILAPLLPKEKAEFEAGPALFGPDLGVSIAGLSGDLFVLPGMMMRAGVPIGDGCEVFSPQNEAQSRGKVVMVTRGGCLFIQKVRNSQRAGADGVIVADNVADPSKGATPSSTPLPFSMSGDGVEDVKIPSLFMQKQDADFLLHLVQTGEEVVVRLSPGRTKEVESGNDEEAESSKEVESGNEKEAESGKEAEFGNDLLSGHLKDLLGQDTSAFTDAMRVAMTKELLKLNSDLSSSADSALAEELLNLKTLGDAESVVIDKLKETVAQKLYEIKIKKGLHLADSAHVDVQEVEEEGHRHSEDTSIGGSNVDT